MELSPDDIRHRKFPVRRRGYDTAAVDAFLGQIAQSVDDADSIDAFETAGREIAHILRATHEEATRLRATANAEAEAILSQAEVEAERIHAQARDERTKTKELLVRSRQRVAEVEAEAEERAATIVGSAEEQARARVADVLRSGRERLEALVTDEQHARRRLMEAHADLQAVIHRVAEPRPVIDLTAPTSALDLGTESGAVAGRAAGQARENPGHPPLPADPSDAMVRGAVDRAVEHSTRPGADRTDEPQDEGGSRD